MSSSSMSTAAATAADHGGGTTSITAVHPDVIRSHILNRLDGPTLASTSCASAHLFSLCDDECLWRDACNSTWPSTTDPRVRDTISAFAFGHRSFFSDAFPALRYHHSGEIPRRHPVSDSPELISAVDIYHEDRLIDSKVLVTETLSTWFLNTPFRLDLLDPKETVPTPLEFDCQDGTSRAAESLRVSWILINPVRRRAVKLASQKPVESRRNWLTGDIQLRYATIVAGSGGEMVQCAVVVSCGKKETGEVHLKEISLQLEEKEGKVVMGMEGLGIIEAAMEGPRWRSDGERERDIYESFMRMKAECRESKRRREKGLDMVCIAVGISVCFAAVWMIFLWRRKNF